MTKQPAKRSKRKLIISVAVIIALLAVVGLPSLKQAGIGYSDAVRDYREELVAFNGELLGTLVRESASRPTLLFIYASWCPYCKQEIEALKAIRKRFGTDELQLLYVSVDQNPYALSQFMLDRQPEERYTPYHVQREDIGAFIESLKNHYGINFDGSVPHLAIFSADGRLQHESLGLVSAYRLQQMLSPLIAGEAAE